MEPPARQWKKLSGCPPASPRSSAVTRRATEPVPGRRATRRRLRRSRGKVEIVGPMAKPSQKRRQVENPQATAPRRAGTGGSSWSRKKRKAQTSARKSVNVQEKRNESATGRKIPSQVPGWRNASPAPGNRGFPARTKRFQKGILPFASDSRTALLQGRLAKATSERIGLRAGPISCACGVRFHGSCP